MYTTSNPNFNYTEFAAKRRRYLEILEAWFDYPPDPDALADELKRLLAPCAPTFALLRHLTPYALETLADTFAGDVEKSDHEDALSLAELVLGEDRYDTVGRVAEWVVSALRTVYKHEPASRVGEALNKFVYVYNKHAGRAGRIRCEFPEWAGAVDEFLGGLSEQLLDHVSQLAGRDAGHVTVPLSRFTIVSETGFLGALFIYITHNRAELPHLFAGDDSIAYAADYKGGPAPTPFISFTQQSTDVTYVPLWEVAGPTRLDFFTEVVHFTEPVAGLEITADTLRTKTVDYEFAPAATYERNVPTATRAGGALRALAFGWSRRFLCGYGWERTLFKHSADDIFGYDRGGVIFMFANSTLSFVKFGDFSIQTVSLLGQLEEVIPCVISSANNAHFGLSSDGRSPLFEVNDVGWDRNKTPFVCYVLDEIIAYLSGPDYSPNETINRTARRR